MPPISTTIIANMALSILGVSPVLSIEDNNKAGKTMNLWFDPTRDEVIRSAVWTFARTRATLARLTDAPDFGWDYQYQLPVKPKCLRMLRLTEDLGSPTYNVGEFWYTGEGSAYVIESDRLLTNYETANIIFLQRVTDPTKFDSMFIKAFAYKLAHDACFDMTGSLERAGQLARQYEHILNVASGTSAIEHHRTPDRNNAWGNAGRGGLLANTVLDSRFTGGD